MSVDDEANNDCRCERHRLDRAVIYRTNTGVDPWVDRGTCPPTFEVAGTPCVSPYFFGVDIFNTLITLQRLLLRKKCRYD